MAPTRNPRVSTVQTPTVLAPSTKKGCASRKYAYPQRSSLRRAIQESLQGPITESPSSSSSTSSLRIHPHSQRSSLRLAIQESLRDLSPVSSGPISTITTPRPSPPPPQRCSLRQALKESLRCNSTAPVIMTPPFTSPAPPSGSISDSHPATPRPAAILSTPPPPPITPPLSVASPPTTSTSASAYNSFRLCIRSRSNTEAHEQRQSPKDSVEQRHFRRTGSKDGDQNGNHGHSCNEDTAKVADRANENGIAANRKGWYVVRSIVAEARKRDGRLVYLVDWEGHDPRTGIGWPSSWVDAKDVSAAAVHEWQGRLEQARLTKTPYMEEGCDESERDTGIRKQELPKPGKVLHLVVLYFCHDNSGYDGGQNHKQAKWQHPNSRGQRASSKQPLEVDGRNQVAQKSSKAPLKATKKSAADVRFRKRRFGTIGSLQKRVDSKA
ncbi:hypothetical protein GGR54DRAFT_642507 [Hypoxylon sp. NC1633]|nr:hypothetical protein GGR54DRAFT_642507 [Hypoxylon sp. NC1633]